MKEQAADNEETAATKQVRPNTPDFKFEHAEEENDREASRTSERMLKDKMVKSVILLQRLLRGRAQQNDMFRGKEMRLDLIQELNVTADYAASAAPEEAAMLHAY
jgi:hypothetical protein